MAISGISKGGQTLVDQMFKKDADKSGALSAAEFKSFAASKSGATKPNSSALEAQFKAMDADGDKKLTKSEAQNFFSLPQLEAPKLTSETTSSLLDMLSKENQAAASSNTPANLLTQLLQNYAKAQASAKSSDSTSA